MRVSEAVAERRSVRGYLDRPVEGDLVRRLLEGAARAPSGGNLQPWHVDVVGGARLDELRAIMAEKIGAGHLEAAEYDIYPRELVEPYRTRRFEIGEALYATMDIARADKDARRREFANNFRFWGAPVALFCTVDRRMGPPQWSDLGMFLQTFMLLAVEAGLATCAQECWAIYPATIRSFLGTPADRMLFCGMAIGYEDTVMPANSLRSARAPLSEWAEFHGF
jgi:nitroreductase